MALTAALVVWVGPRLVAERRFQARLRRPVPPWPPVPVADGPDRPAP